MGVSDDPMPYARIPDISNKKPQAILLLLISTTDPKSF